MSFKAYFVGCRTHKDIDALSTYLGKMADIAFINYVGQLKKGAVIRQGSYRGSFRKGDVVVAITVDRGDLAESFVEEGGLSSPLMHVRLEIRDLRHNMELIKSSDKTWVKDCKEALEA